LIAGEVFLIGILDYAVANYFPIEMGGYISMIVFYCVPIIHTAGRYDTQTSIFAGMALAFASSATEAALTWPYFPMITLALNTFTRSVAFTVIGWVLIRLWPERECARTDALTDLANRLELWERLQIEQNVANVPAGLIRCCSLILTNSR
jgi:hypothetical protein